jgi:hypothetical protein
MSKLGSLLGGLIFLAIAAIALYRLLFWFPITIGGHEIGQTASFLTCAASAGLALMFFFGNKSVAR